MIAILKEFFRQATVGGSRSTALQPLQWALGILLSATICSAVLNAPSWLTVTFSALSISIVVLFVVAFVYFMLTAPDALRSERFTLKKMAIERGILGDSLVGTLDEPGNQQIRDQALFAFPEEEVDGSAT